MLYVTEILINSSVSDAVTHNCLYVTNFSVNKIYLKSTSSTHRDSPCLHRHRKSDSTGRPKRSYTSLEFFSSPIFPDPPTKNIVFILLSLAMKHSCKYGLAKSRIFDNVLRNTNLADLWIHTWLISPMSLLVSGTGAWWEWYPHYGLRVQEQGRLIISSRLQLLHLKIC